MKSKKTRRSFLKQSTLAGAGMYFAARSSWAAGNAPSSRIRFAGIGVGGRGSGDVWAVARVVGPENIVALVDVDADRAKGVMGNPAFRHAKKFKDYRKMLQQMRNDIDAVIVATPDHSHAPASLMAMRMGKHCYCEKPLTWCVKEARLMREVAAEKRLATQMGNQGTSGNRFREGVEVVQSGMLGEVREVYVWTNRPIWPQGLDAVFNRHSGVKKALHGPLEGGVISAPIRDTLAWDLWLGPAPARPYDPIYLPFNWRGWYDFGTGALGDMACHTMNLPYMALRLTAPTEVEAEVSCLNPETYPEWSTIRSEFPARGSLPPVTLYWFDGRANSPRHFAKQLQNSKVTCAGKAASEVFRGQRLSGSGSLMVGTEGMLYSTDDYGNRWKLLPEERFRQYKKPEQKLPRSPGHHREWVEAIRGGRPAMSNFNYAGPLTEAVLLGVVALRARGAVKWDAERLEVINNREANRFVSRQYREGWTL